MVWTDPWYGVIFSMASDHQNVFIRGTRIPQYYIGRLSIGYRTHKKTGTADLKTSEGVKV